MKGVLKNSCFILSFFVIGCSSTQMVLKGVELSFASVQSIVAKHLPLGRRELPETRTLYSSYFIEQDGYFVPAQNAPRRKYVKAVISGVGRPYVIRLEVIVEERKIKTQVFGDYKVVGYDKALTKVIFRRIQKEVFEKRQKLNVIDGFKAF